MPLVILSGPPLTFKSTFGRLLFQDAVSRGIDAILVTPESLSLTPKNFIGAGMIYVRKRIKDAVSRYLTKSRLVIVDSTNHAKSFRYELYCTAREVNTSFCVIRTYRSTSNDVLDAALSLGNSKTNTTNSNDGQHMKLGLKLHPSINTPAEEMEAFIGDMKDNQFMDVVYTNNNELNKKTNTTGEMAATKDLQQFASAVSELSYCIDEEAIYQDVLLKLQEYYVTSDRYLRERRAKPEVYRTMYQWAWEDYEDLSSRFEPYVEDAKWEQPAFNLFRFFSSQGRATILDYAMDPKNALKSNKVTQMSDKMFE